MADRPIQADLAAIRKMAATHTLREIGRELGVSRQTVLNWSRLHGIRTASMSEAGKRRILKMPMSMPTGMQHRKHSAEFYAEISALKGVKPATQIAREYGLASKNVVIGIWNRPR